MRAALEPQVARLLRPGATLLTLSFSSSGAQGSVALLGFSGYMSLCHRL